MAGHDSLDSSWVDVSGETIGTKDRRHSRDSGNASQEEYEALDNENQEIPANSEDSYDIIPENLTLAKIINILNQAVREDDCEELDKVVQNIEDYEGRSITLDNVNLKSFCEQQLNLDLRDRSDHQHIYSNVLSQYKFDQEGFKYDYSVKELVLLAIAANDELAKKYQDILFAEENLSLLLVLVGGQKYIEAFIEKFHGTDRVYGRLKDQAIQLVEPNKIDFFSVIALRKEQELLNAVFVKYVLRDFGQVLKTSKPDPLYGVLETASSVKNEEFITIVLGAFERYINEPTKKASTKELLKKSFATLLETAISQEHTSVIECLCKRYTNSADRAIYDVYEQAFADDKVITILRQQILKNIEVRGRKEIYDLILKTALGAGNIAFIERLCKECAECSNDVINYLDHKLKNNEFDNTCESTLVALSNVEYTNTDVIVKVLFYTKEIHQNVSHNEQVIRQTIQNILRNATHYSTGQEDYSLVKGVCYLCTEIDAINVIFQEECEIFRSSIEKRIEDLEKENKLLQSKALREYNNSYLPGIINGLVQAACTVYDEYTKDPTDNKRQENTDLILSLMQIRNILQFSIDVQECPYHERQDLWDEMCQAPGTFTMRKRSHNVAGELEIPVITSDILSDNPGFESTDSQQPQENIVDNEKDIMNSGEASEKKPIGNNCEEIMFSFSYNGGKVHPVNMMTNSYSALKQQFGNDKSSSKQSHNTGTTPKKQNKPTGSNTTSSPNDQLKRKLADYVRQNNIEQVKKSFNQAGAGAFELLKYLMSATISFQGLHSGDRKKRGEIIKYFIEIASQNLSPKDCKKQEEIMEPLKDALRKLSDVSDKPKTPEVSPVTQEAESNDGQFANLSSGSATAPRETFNASFEEINKARIPANDEKDDQQGSLPPSPQSLMSDGDDKCGDSPSGSGSSSPIQDIVNEEELIVITTRQPNDSKHDKTVFKEHQDDSPEKENSTPPLVPPTVPVSQKQGEDVTDSKEKPITVAAVEKTSAIPQNTKSSKLPVIAASALAIAGIISGVAVAVYLEMLAVGIAVGACCLIAATIIYCCRPKSSIEKVSVLKENTEITGLSS